MRRRASIVGLGLLLCAVAAGCGASAPAATGTPGPASSTEASPSATAPSTEGALALPVTVHSVDGREVTVTDTTRVVSLLGSITEVMFELDLGDQLVGRDITATLPEAAHLPLVTRAHDVSAEAVLSLHPTLVLASEDTGPSTAIDHIRNVGVPVVRLPNPRSVDDIGPRIMAIATALGVPEAGERLVAETDAELAAIRDSVPAPAEPLRVAFLYMRGQAGVYLLAGPTSGADSMIRAAGALDAGTEMGLDRAFTPITSEALVSAAPDVILMTTTGLESVGGIDGLVQIPGIGQTPAGIERRVVTIDDALLYSFGPRTPDALCHLLTGFYGTVPAADRCRGGAR